MDLGIESGALGVGVHVVEAELCKGGAGYGRRTGLSFDGAGGRAPERGIGLERVPVEVFDGLPGTDTVGDVCEEGKWEKGEKNRFADEWHLIREREQKKRDKPGVSRCFKSFSRTDWAEPG